MENLYVGNQNEKVTVKEVQDKLLDILVDIDKLCDKHNIPYFLLGGTALGAFRHQGFIPWDDDIDIAMKKEDYDNFVEILKKELDPKYYFHCYKTDKKYNVLIPAMKIRLKGTYIEEVNDLLKNKCEGNGLFIDVFVFDYVSKSKIIDLPFRVFNQILMPIIVFFENININPIWLKNLFVNNAIFYGKLNKKSKYIGFDLTWTFKSCLKPYVFKYDDIYPVKKMKFENFEFNVANNIEDFLTIAIAPSFRELPKESDRKPKHIKNINLKGDTL